MLTYVVSQGNPNPEADITQNPVASWPQRNSFIANTGLNNDINRIPTVSTASASKPSGTHTKQLALKLCDRYTGHRQAGGERFLQGRCLRLCCGGNQKSRP